MSVPVDAWLAPGRALVGVVHLDALPGPFGLAGDGPGAAIQV